MAIWTSLVSLHKPTHRADVPVDSPTRADMVWDPAWGGIGGAHVPDRHWIWDRPACCSTSQSCPTHDVEV